MKTMKLMFIVALLSLLIGQVFGQAPTGSLRGSATDPAKAVVVGAQVVVTENSTGTSYTTQTSTSGDFSVANLLAGDYTVTITKKGYKKGVYKDVHISVSDTYTLSAHMEIGAESTSVEVIAGQEVLQTESATIGTTISGRQILDLPFTSRSALDLAQLMPGAQTSGRARQTTFDGLPKGSINITYDGINVQDNLLKSNDGFFTIIRPTVDAVGEFSISTAANSAADGSQGATQIKFQTNRGGNAFHGGVWETLRNDYFNSNYFFNNIIGAPRQKQRLNQWGGKAGGYLWKDKLFFFADIDNATNPQSRSFTRVILTQNASNGLFTYGVSAAQGAIAAPNAWTTCVAADVRNAGAATCTANLAQFATAKGLSYTADPAVATIFSNVQAIRSSSIVNTSVINNTYTDLATFNAPGKDNRHYPDARLDFNATKSDQISATYHYSHFLSSPDFLNNLNPVFPVAPFNATGAFGSQISNRNQWALSWRHNIGQNMSNELIAGLQTALVAFFPDQSSAYYPTATLNIGTVNVRPVFSANLGITAPIIAYNTQGRNTPYIQLSDNFTWSRGKHTLAFGGEVEEIRFHQFIKGGRAVQTANIGMVSSDPANGQFSSTNFPGISTTNLSNVAALFASISGRISSYAGTISVDPNTRAFVAGAPNQQAGKQHQFGFYGSDSWRVRNNLTATIGLRWDIQLAPQDTLNDSFSLVNGYADVFGVSGMNNLFKPGTLTGSVPSFQLNNGRQWYNADKGEFAPNVGLAWQPEFENSWMKKLLPGGGKTVLRAGYSWAYTREGFNNFNSIAFSNPGIDGSIFASPVSSANCAVVPAAGTYNGGCLSLSQLLGGGLQTAATNPSSFAATGTFPGVPYTGGSVSTVNVQDPNLKVPRVQSWSVGVQRELNKSTVVEIRYVANHSTGLWRQDNLNEINIVENGFLTEFNNAKANLAANIAGGCGSRFDAVVACAANGSVNTLPIFTAAFQGLTLGSGFSSGSFITQLNNGVAGSMANTLALTQTFMCNLAGKTAPAMGTACNGITTAPAGLGPYPANFFLANPTATSGAFRIYNGAQSTYNSLQVEVRRRPTKGLQYTANYVYSKSLTNSFADSSVNFASYTSLRNQRYDKGLSAFDTPHAFKFNGIYDLPFGTGHKLASSNWLMSRLIDNWSFSAIQRWQSGRVFLLTSGLGGTINQNDPGVILASGVTAKSLQNSLGIRITGNQVFYTPTNIATMVSPCNTAGALCQRVFLRGPSFYRADLSLIKKFKITERFNTELQMHALNAFNNVNFFYPGDEAASVNTAAVSSTTFGRVTNSFRDANTTQDNGGRILEFTFRINF